MVYSARTYPVRSPVLMVYRTIPSSIPSVLENRTSQVEILGCRKKAWITHRLKPVRLRRSVMTSTLAVSASARVVVPKPAESSHCGVISSWETLPSCAGTHTVQWENLDHVCTLKLWCWIHPLHISHLPRAVPYKKTHACTVAAGNGRHYVRYSRRKPKHTCRKPYKRRDQ